MGAALAVVELKVLTEAASLTLAALRVELVVAADSGAGGDGTE